MKTIPLRKVESGIIAELRAEIKRCQQSRKTAKRGYSESDRVADTTIKYAIKVVHAQFESYR